MKPVKMRQGFTLIELMIVISIIGLLASIAIPNFMNYQSRSRTGEAKSNLAAIATSEVSYFAEYGHFAGSLPGLMETYPAMGPQYPSTEKQNWAMQGTFCGIACYFDLIDWVPDGPVFYDYGVAAEDSTTGTAVRFVAYAVGDVDDDGRMAYLAYIGADESGAYDASICAPCAALGGPPIDAQGQPIIESVAVYQIGQGSDDF